ncbi:MAG TPA: hypothetical protein VF771_08500 [Longimicrobiaceae bacterium]
MISRRACIALALAAAAVAGCRGAGDGEARAAVRVDSAQAIPRALAGFRRGVPETRELGGAFADSRDSLVARFAAALERADTAAFMPMMMDRAEFAWLYYDTDPQSKPPYELPPDLMWMQMMQQGEKGISRALGRFGGRPLAYRGYACEREYERGENRVWTLCRVDVADRDGRRAKPRLFGGIIERGGRYKIFSYANEL